MENSKLADMVLDFARGLVPDVSWSQVHFSADGVAWLEDEDGDWEIEIDDPHDLTDMESQILGALSAPTWRDEAAWERRQLGIC